MVAALRSAEGGIFFQNPQGGIFKIFPARGVYHPLPPIPDPWLNPIGFSHRNPQRYRICGSPNDSFVENSWEITPR